MIVGLGNDNIIEGDMAFANILAPAISHMSMTHSELTSEQIAPFNPTVDKSIISLNSILSDYGWIIGLGILGFLVVK